MTPFESLGNWDFEFACNLVLVIGCFEKLFTPHGAYSTNAARSAQ
jgi:hypothetical protein